MDSSRFVEFICDKVFPVFDELSSSKDSLLEDSSTEAQLDMLKALSELIAHCHNLNAPAKKAQSVYKILLVCFIILYDKPFQYYVY